MRVLVVGGTGRIGSAVIKRIRELGHDARAAAPDTGVDVITGVGLDEAMDGVDVVVDVTNSPSWGDEEVLSFFTTSTSNQLAAEKRAGVRHHVAVSIVGARELPSSGYLRAKVAQEDLIRAGGVQYTILRSTQFFEFIAGIADSATVDGKVRLPAAPFRPVAAADVVSVVVDLATSDPVNGVVELSGPEPSTLQAMAARVLAANSDSREVVVDPSARYFGADISGGQLVPADESGRIGAITLTEWLQNHR